MKVRALVFAGVFALAIPQVHAMNWLVGGSIGDASMDLEANGSSFSSSDTAWKAFAGMRAFKYFGVEGGYQDLGTAQVDMTGFDAQAGVSGWDGFVVGVVPIGKFELFGKAGYMLWQADNSVNTGSGTIKATTDGSDVAFGAGAAFKATENFAIRGEWEQFNFDADTIQMFSVGVDFRF